MKFYYFSFITIFCVFIIFTLYSTLLDIENTNVINQIEFCEDSTQKTNPSKIKAMKYILQWTSASDVGVPLVDMGRKQEGFLRRNCPYVNCYVTSNRTLLGDLSRFDAIVFQGTDLDTMTMASYGTDLPDKRSTHQKYVFACIESAAAYGVYPYTFDGYFNWTWTYKLDSDIRWGYIVVRDMKNNVVGPKIDMNWIKMEDMDPVTVDFKQKLKTKRKAAAWFVSNCQSENRRENLFEALRKELLKYKHLVDVYGDCGVHVCNRNTQEVCDKKIAKEYYFYLSFENACSEDYVTEKLLRALQNDAVPVVFGGANYTRFMPDGIYLNALDLGVKKLAAKMNELIKDPDKYANYFRWKNHYKYEQTTDHTETNEYCKMCAMLNDEEAVKNTTVYRNFRRWWNQDQTEFNFFEKKLNSALTS